MPQVSVRQPLRPVSSSASSGRLRLRPASSAVARASRWAPRQPRVVAVRLGKPQAPSSSSSIISQLMGAELASRRSSALGGSSLGRAPRPRAQLRQRDFPGRFQVRSEADAPSDGRLPSLDPMDFSKIPLPPHPLLHRGQLANGLRYVVLPNAKPPSRFEAHLEIHAGSVDEEEDEQGLAHLVEHVVYMGSRKRERLLGTGSRSNAYTDFHHTVFHVHSPVTSPDGQPLLPQVLESLHEIAFDPLFLESRIDKERRAVLSEGQMMNTIEYRVDCQLLQHLHWENALGNRFPIGLAEQIETWSREKLVAFHRKWYFPANTTLYLVGDFEEDVPALVKAIEKMFGSVPPAMDGDKPRQRHPFRPPVKHVYGLQPHVPVPGPETGALPGAIMQGEGKVQVFQHALLRNFTVNMFCKLPVRRVTAMDQLRRTFMARLVLSVLQFRATRRYWKPDCPFISLDLDHSDTGREGCFVTTLTVSAEPEKWEEALKAAVAEMRLMQQFGIQQGELERYVATLMRDSDHLASQVGSVPSIDNLDFIMESDALGHAVLDQVQGNECLLAIAETVTLEDVNDVVVEMVGYIGDYGLAPGERDPRSGVATAIVACVPEAYGDGRPFSVTGEEIERVLRERGTEIASPKDISVPEHLIQPSAIAALCQQMRPRFVLLDGSEPPAGWQPPPADEVTGVAMRRLSNGIRVNYKVTLNEPQSAVLRLVAPGGRAAEAIGAGARGCGAVLVGARALSEYGFSVGEWDREQVNLFCLERLFTVAMDADEEFLSIDCQVAVGDAGLQPVMELLHLALAQPHWEAGSLRRAKQIYLYYHGALDKSLEGACRSKVMGALLGPDRRFVDPSEEEVQPLSLDGVRDAVQAQLSSGQLELNVVGDFDPRELDELVLQYLGTAAPPRPQVLPLPELPVALARAPAGPTGAPLPRAERFFLSDSEKRAYAFLAGPAPNAWGWGMPSAAQAAAANQRASGTRMDGPQGGSVALPGSPLADDARRRAHPLFPCAALVLLQELVNSRLFTTVRDSLGLTYDVSFELTLFDRLEAGWYRLAVTSTPEKIDEALAASLRTLRGVGTHRVTPRELDRSRRTLLTRHESECKDNRYLLGLLAHLQSDLVPRKTLDSLKDWPEMLEACTVEDVYWAYVGIKMGDEDVVSCVGVAGTLGPGEANGVNPLTKGAPQQQPVAAVAEAAAALANAAAAAAAAAAAQQQALQQRMQGQLGEGGASAFAQALQAVAAAYANGSAGVPPNGGSAAAAGGSSTGMEGKQGGRA